MTVASATPTADVMAQAPQNTAPAVPSQQDWRASSGQAQATWPQQNSYPAQPGPSQSPSTYDPYSQRYGSGTAQMANEPAPNSNHVPGTNSIDSSGANASGYDPARAGSPGRGYGVDPNMTAQNSHYGMQERPIAGTVAAQPAPAYQSQYNPSGAASQTSDRQTTNGYGPSTGYGLSTQKSVANAGAGRTVNTKLFEIDYTNPPQPMAVGRVELWGTRDGGVTWQSFGYDTDSRSPMLARVPDEGTYGFNVVFHPMHGQPTPAPRRGQTPDILVRVDLTRPSARLIGVDRSPSQPNELTIRWQASDAQLTDTPISLYYADAATGQWLPIAKDLRNSGDYRWYLPANLPSRLQIRVDAQDMAGNIATAETRSPIRLAASPRPQGRVAPYSVQVQDVRPVGQTGQAAPRRYYIR